MRLSIRPLAVLVACAGVASAALAAKSATPASKPLAAAPKKKPLKQNAAAKEARGFLEEITGFLWPVATATNQADWTAATDVTPEHTGQRTGADKVQAALIGSKRLIEKTKALLANEKQLDEE